MSDEKVTEKGVFALLEEEVLDFWNRSDIFGQSVKREAPQGDFVFYDGPPFATGLPHYGHLLASSIKDAVPRYKTMRGYRVKRRWGWDCHGLPIENLAEQELGLADKRGIEEMGVEKFNDYCRSIVMRYATEWRVIINRLGRWVDMENDYKTMDVDFMESGWAIMKKLWEKQLLYKGHKAMHICPRCGTTLSNFEVGQGYKDIKDLSVVAKFELVDEPGAYILAWTTTPWTLPGNAALAVGADIDYVKAKIECRVPSAEFNAVFIAARKYIESLDKEKYVIEILETYKGDKLLGKRYQSLFDYYSSQADLKNRENGWQIYTGDFVTTDDGTGIVHIAPAFGEDDMKLGQEHGLPFIQHVDAGGRFVSALGELAGREVKPKGDHMSADIEIIKLLAASGKLFSKEKYEHSYPHCWRCESPLLNYATESWFISASALRERMKSENDGVNWTPEHVKEGRFGKWLEQARDWAVSRNRYWGATMPVWECGACGDTVVVGSRAELKELSGAEVDDLHKEVVDKVRWPCAKCGGEMHRVPEVLDCWFDSGSMPYAQNHYPFENQDWVAKHYQADFIAEGLDQTRGWFYTLTVLGAALEDKIPFRNVIVNGIVLAEDGQKMSKSKKNYPDPMLLVDRYGADTIRHYLLSSPAATADSLSFSEKSVQEQLRNTLMLIKNILVFYETFADETVACTRPAHPSLLDAWILTRLDETIAQMTKGFEEYDLPRALRPLESLIDDFSTWYLRRSRDRFKSDDLSDKDRALQTTKYVLDALAKLMAPSMPFFAEWLWQTLHRHAFANPELSVHLLEWPASESYNQILLNEMKSTREIVQLGLSERDAASLKVRQPLASIKVFSAPLWHEERRSEHENLIADELNVKRVEMSEAEAGVLRVELDKTMSPELITEGFKRELVRLINAERKAQGLSIGDQASVLIYSDGEQIAGCMREHLDGIMKETLSRQVTMKSRSEANDTAKVAKVNGEEAVIELQMSEL